MKEKNLNYYLLDNYLLVCVVIILILISILYFKNNRKSNSQYIPKQNIQNIQNIHSKYNKQDQIHHIREQSQYIEKQLEHIQKLHDDEWQLHIQQEHQELQEHQGHQGAYELQRKSYMNKQLYPNEQVAKNLEDPSSLFIQERNNEVSKDLKMSKNIPDVIKVRLLPPALDNMSPLPILSSYVMPENIIMPSA